MVQESQDFKYNTTAKTLHWVISLLVVGMLCAGYFMVWLPKDSNFKWEIYSLHKAFGITVFALIIVRLINRFISPPVPYPLEFSKKSQTVGKVAHIILYVCVFLMPITGYIMSSAGGNSITWFFNIHIPLLIAKNPFISYWAFFIHFYAAVVLIIMIALHILGVLKHIFVDKYNILSRML